MIDNILKGLRYLVEQRTRNQNAAVAEVPQVGPLAVNINEGMQMHKLVESILKLKPPKFAGEGDPKAATQWIKELEKVFALLRFIDENKITLAVYRMRGNASNWWEAFKGQIFPKGAILRWDTFVEAFYGKYFLDCARERKLNEFMHPRQNRMTMDQYEARFTVLSRYAPRMVENLKDKAKRFRDGLGPKIKDVLVPFNLKDYIELYQSPIGRNEFDGKGCHYF
ncbi:uncharacterized protein LOC115742113 [Rhodamnia argentea]|uniref:Uncharacterized protein LOC115742113 n=1 Tax=Rhodamnia argentea TaxID=178133 RepID=A0A8B8PBC8_9MYRT|nr:uncharacterized protein LOC115742113 [Rhodamnia argentea]